MKPPTSAYAEEAKAHPADYVTEGGLQMVSGPVQLNLCKRKFPR